MDATSCPKFDLQISKAIRGQFWNVKETTLRSRRASVRTRQSATTQTTTTTPQLRTRTTTTTR